MTDAPLKELLHAKGIKLVEVAAALGVDKATVTKWGQSKIPVDRVREVEKVTGIAKHLLRPDVWDAPEPEADQ